MKKILVINCGSSSLKFQLYNVENDNYEVVSKGIAERIGMENSVIKIQYGNNPKQTHQISMPTHSEAIRGVFDLLLKGALKSMDELDSEKLESLRMILEILDGFYKNCDS